MKKIIPILVIIASTLLITTEALSLPSCSGAVWNNCFGTYTYTTGDKYTGEWENNLAHGEGTYIWIAGEQYSGEWENDEFNGLGTYTHTDGTSQYGIWEDGKYLFGPVFYRLNLSGDCPTGSWKPADVCEKLPDNCRPDKSRKNSAKCGRKIEQFEVLTVVDDKQSKKVEEKLKAEEENTENQQKYCSGNTVQFYDNCIGEWTFELDHPNWPGATYTGEWKNGKPDGNGTSYYGPESNHEGTKYVGEFKDGLAHGYGVMTGPDGESYKGIWLYDKMSEGTIIWADGSTYTGQFKNGKLDGQGTAIRADGQVEKGEFRDGEIIKGTVDFPSGNRYEGEFRDGEIIKGTVDFPSGNRYEGEFRDGEFIKGTVDFPSGNRYEGELENSEFNGQGTMVFEGGSTYVGEFKDNEFIYGTIDFPSGNRYEGGIINSGFDGQGKLTLADGSVYEGEFKNNDFNGQGKLVTSDGKVLEGIFKDGELLYPEETEEIKQAMDDEILPAASGSGFAVTSDGYVITNYHVIEGCSGIEIYNNTQPIPANVINFDLNNDIALLKADFNPLHYFPLRTKNPELLMDIYAAGFPFGYDISTPVKVTRGIISSLSGAGNNYSNIQTDATIQPGNSGGPIVDNKGNVVAVAVATLDLEEVFEAYGVVPEGTHFGIKSNVVINFLESNNVSLIEPNDKPLSGEALGRMITDGTYYISCLMTMAQINEMRERKALFSNLK